MKLSLQEKKQDLEHSVKRAEQYETEVKHLRLRVDELKLELSQSQSDVCIDSNNFKISKFCNLNAG